jgi:hypothetical protein
LEDVPCEDLTNVVVGLVKHGAFKAMRQQLRKIVEVPMAVPNLSTSVKTEPAQAAIRAEEIPEGGPSQEGFGFSRRE